MIAPITARAARDAAELEDHYVRLERYEAVRNLARAIAAAQSGIPKISVHKASPTIYPQLARPGTAWVRFGRYWFAYGTRPPHSIRAIIYETANLPKRIGASGFNS